MALESKGNRMARSTAEGACSMRAAGALLSDPALRGPDHMAASMISPGFNIVALVKIPGLRRLTPHLIDRVLPGGIWFEIARTKSMDEMLAAEVAAGADQVIMLGAGLDTRPYRMAEQLEGAVVFEVDHPITAELKRKRLEAVLGGRPDHVRYVTIDFNREDLATVLAAGGHDPALRSVVIWSGVAPYLQPAGVEATLRWMAGQAPGSVIVFDYCWQEVIDGELDHIRNIRILRQRVESQGEPLLWGIPQGTTEAYLRDLGLELVEDLGTEDMVRYVTASDGTIPTEIWDFGGIARAKVPG